MRGSSNKYFEKVENNRTYRIYLMDNGCDPWLCRSSLDVVDGMHGELVESVNGANDAVYNSIISKYAPVIGYEKAFEIARNALRTFIIATMEYEGWTMFSE